MTEVPGARSLLQAQRGVRRDMRTLFSSAARQAGAAVNRYAGRDGTIPERLAQDAARDAGHIIQRVFVAADGRTSVDIAGRPVSPYASVLLYHVAWTVSEVVEVHRRIMRRYAPEDVERFLIRRARGPVRVLEQDLSDDEVDDLAASLRIFHPNPLAEGAFDPSRQWVRPDKWQDPRGYRLSDRIWEASNRTRMKVDALVMDAIRSGTSAENLARLLEQFVIPGRQPLRTDKPYGRDASFDAMRLARTEIGRGHAQASWISSYLNPYVDKMNWRLSPAHPRIDICDNLAEGSPYALETCPLPIVASHPMCICVLIPQVTDSPATVTARLREVVQASERRNLQPFMTPIAGRTFTQMLLGNALTLFLQQMNPAQLVMF